MSSLPLLLFLLLLPDSLIAHSCCDEPSVKKKEVKTNNQKQIIKNLHNFNKTVTKSPLLKKTLLRLTMSEKLNIKN